jgi:hypothetical protein
MTASILVRDFLFRVSTQLNDISPQFTRWTERELVSYTSDGQKVVAKFLPYSCSRIDAVKLQPGTKQSIEKIAANAVIPGDGSAPAVVYGNYLLGVVRNMGANGATPGQAIRIVDREVLDTVNPEWHTQSGAPITQYTFDPRTPKVFYVCPCVPANTAPWVEISFLANPVDIAAPGVNQTLYGMNGSNSTLLSIDDKYVDDLMNYVLARCYLKDATFAGDSNLATAHTQMFVGSINAQVAALTGVNPNLQSLPLNPNVPAAAK